MSGGQQDKPGREHNDTDRQAEQDTANDPVASNGQQDKLAREHSTTDGQAEQDLPQDPSEEDVQADPEDEAGSRGLIEELQEKIAGLEKLAAQNLDQALRSQAELDNVRKRSDRDIENAHKYALEKFINELLPVLDSLELGIAAAEDAKDIGSLSEGMKLTLKMFLGAMEKCGVNPVIPQKGDKFNPEQHDAVSTQEQDSVNSGEVIDALQKGYELNGRLIRPAMVVVAK